MTKKELLEKRAKLVADARAIQDAAQTESRDMTVEESANFDKYVAEAHGVKAEVDALQKGDERRASLAEIESQMRSEERATARGRGIDPAKGGDQPEKGTPERQMRGFRAWISRKPDQWTDEDRECVAELRALQAGVDVSGGFTVPPNQFVAELIEAVRNDVLMRQLGQVVPLNTGEAIDWPTLETYPEDPDWTSEVAAVDLDTATAFGKRTWTPHKLSKGIPVSEKLLQVSALPIESIVRDLMAYKFATLEEAKYLNGTGVNQPLGIFTASDLGVPTSRDVSTGNSTTSIQWDGLRSARGTLKKQYRSNAGWLFHRDAVTQISKLKDGDGRYLWQVSTTAGAPDTVDGHPLYESEYAPNIFTTGLYVGAFGDFSKYRIVDFMGAQIVWKRHTEYLAGVDLSGTDQVGFSARKWTDGGPSIGEAFVRIKLA